MILPRLRGAAGPSRLPDDEDDPNPDAQLQSIPNEKRVRLSFNLSFPTQVQLFKVSGPSSHNPGVYHYSELSFTGIMCSLKVTQAAPGCDMALVHDDDLQYVDTAVRSSICCTVFLSSEW